MSFEIKKVKRKSHMFSVRMTDDAHEKLKEASEVNDRSLNQEIASRLERSLFFDEIAGGTRTSNFVNLIGVSIAAIESETGTSWLEDPSTWERVRKLILAETKKRSPR